MDEGTTPGGGDGHAEPMGRLEKGQTALQREGEGEGGGGEESVRRRLEL